MTYLLITALTLIAPASFATLPTYPAKNDTIFETKECRIAVDSLGRQIFYAEGDNSWKVLIFASLDSWMPEGCHRMLQIRKIEIETALKNATSPTRAQALRELLLLIKPANIAGKNERQSLAPSDDGGGAR